ncbi:uncharacterized protein J7T54_001309 [Emericellopsis cladophorae]|uniref:USP domain-containing protein n=1 Tax=Emericellopsis cladophorae TaxID=2686198 RepID=A0A9Q0BEH5_9HYPO|nr:uncharacterized protein J7T54_001309 [Emericellopsis cladophorae]KAI6782452.1 hypothetical protein J7T54_001309 [Emericellopsis cladophorae]
MNPACLTPAEIPSLTVDLGQQSSRSSGADAFRNIFNKNNGDKEENENDVQRRELELKFNQVQRRIQELAYHDVGRERIEISISSEYAQGDVDKAVDYIDIQQKAIRGEIIPYNPEVHMVGAENRGAVTCYLDTLLFSMFAKMDAFECMLKNDFPEDKAKDSLVKLLRMWVNMLRTGRLIGTDLTEEIQNSLAACGWPEAGLLEQQDTSEAFGFLTETLQLPLLSLQVDLFHHGKKDDADRKVVYERLLNLAVPEDPHGKGVKLEDCLEEYFNTRVEVNRDSEEAKMSKLENGPLLRRPSMLARNTIKILTDGVPSSTAMTASPLAETAPVSQPKSHEMEAEPECEHVETQIDVDVADQPGDAGSGGEDASLLEKAKRKGSTVVKTVTIPAWQFFRLIPWHSLAKNAPQNDTEVAMNFDQRPVVGICLKRYTFSAKGEPMRQNTYIDIPDSLRLPHFMLADGATVVEGENSTTALTGDYKLVLQRHDVDPPPDYEDPQWVKFDDLQTHGRVQYVDDIKVSLRDEMPYLLFYQIIPIADDPPSDEDTAPPSYEGFRMSVDEPTTPMAEENYGTGESSDCAIEQSS